MDKDKESLNTDNTAALSMDRIKNGWQENKDSKKREINRKKRKRKIARKRKRIEQNPCNIL